MLSKGGIMIGSIKVVEPKDLLITVIVENDRTCNEIKRLTLDPKNNEDAYTFVQKVLVLI